MFGKTSKYSMKSSISVLECSAYFSFSDIEIFSDKSSISSSASLASFYYIYSERLPEATCYFDTTLTDLFLSINKTHSLIKVFIFSSSNSPLNFYPFYS